MFSLAQVMKVGENKAAGTYIQTPHMLSIVGYDTAWLKCSFMKPKIF